jgi:hypothetical protein
MRNPIYQQPHLHSCRGNAFVPRSRGLCPSWVKIPCEPLGIVSCCCVVFARAQTPKGTLTSPRWTLVISALLFGVSLNRSWLTPQRVPLRSREDPSFAQTHVSQLLEQPEPFPDPVPTREI